MATSPIAAEVGAGTAVLLQTTQQSADYTYPNDNAKVIAQIGVKVPSATAGGTFDFVRKVYATTIVPTKADIPSAKVGDLAIAYICDSDDFTGPKTVGLYAFTAAANDFEACSFASDLS